MALPTDLNMELPLQGYFIYRDFSAGQEFDPTTPLNFYPPKDSDELFDALRIKYPHLTKHSERMRQAVIEFYLEEQNMSATAMTSPVDMTNMDSTSPWLQSQTWPSMSSGSSTTFSSPETLALATPDYGMSPQPQVPELSRQHSTAESSATPASEPSNPSPPCLENMTGVFSISTSNQPKQRVRRKMTEAEKIDYRARRLAKACEKCQKRKRKCDHNLPDMEARNAPTTKQKVTKIRSDNGNLAPHQTSGQGQAMSFSQPQFFDEPIGGDMQLFDEFTNIFEDPLPDLFNDEKLPFPDMSLNAPYKNGKRAHLSQNPMQYSWGGLLPQGLPQEEEGTRINSEAGTGLAARVQAPTGGRGRGPRTEKSMDSADGQTTRSTNYADGFGTATLQNDAMCCTRATSYDGYQHNEDKHNEYQQQPGGSKGMLWEHQRTGQQLRPTHDAHTRFVEGDGAYVYDGSGGEGQVMSEPAADGPLEGMTINDYLRMKTNFSDAEKAGRLFVSSASGRIPSQSSATSNELASTSVPDLSRTLLQQESAAQQQGRPTLSLGEGIARAASPSTELYMLRKRVSRTIPGQNDTPSAAKPHQWSTAGEQWEQDRANGGAYLRLDPNNSSRPIRTHRLDPNNSARSIANGDADRPLPVHTRVTATSSGAIERPVAATLPNTQQAQQVTAAAGIKANNDLVTIPRLRDTFRRRDHFGRFEAMQNAASVIAVVGGVFMLANLLQHFAKTDISASLLLLALLAPAPGAKGTHFREPKNSSWLCHVRTARFAKGSGNERSKENLPGAPSFSVEWPGTVGDGKFRRSVRC